MSDEQKDGKRSEEFAGEEFVSADQCDMALRLLHAFSCVHSSQYVLLMQTGSVVSLFSNGPDAGAALAWTEITLELADGVAESFQHLPHVPHVSRPELAAVIPPMVVGRWNEDENQEEECDECKRSRS